MAVDHIRYDILVQDALRGAVRRVLMDTAENGLPGEHHFYISFDTRADGVRLSPRMLAQYPTEMTVVLQHQFWDLVVTESGFEVGVSFGGVPELLTVPRRNSIVWCARAKGQSVQLIRAVGGGGCRPGGADAGPCSSVNLL